MYGKIRKPPNLTPVEGVGNRVYSVRARGSPPTPAIGEPKAVVHHPPNPHLNAAGDKEKDRGSTWFGSGVDVVSCAAARQGVLVYNGLRKVHNFFQLYHRVFAEVNTGREVVLKSSSAI